MSESANVKRNLITFPLGTLGRDMIYALFTNFLYTYVLFTRQLTNGQLLAISGIMIAARVFDALNDPIMGNIIDRTRTRIGKFKPWLIAGILSTSVVVYLAFNTSLQGWSFVWFFGFIYFMYSITYTMHDISFWGMIPALGSEADLRDKFTSRTTLVAGIGGALAGFFIPRFTTGEGTLGGSAAYAFGRVALVICILAPLFMCITIIGTRENREYNKEPQPPISFKKIVGTIKGNDQLLWIALAFLLQQVGNGITVGGLGATYIYFSLGYEGGYYSNFSTFGLAASAVLMVTYPAISKKINRKPLMKKMLFLAGAGYLLMILIGLFFPTTNPGLKCWMLTFGYMLANFGQYGYYLIMMISIMNTVEYNELKNGERCEAIISSLRPFITKLGSALCVVIITLSYIIFGVKEYTNAISSLEQQVQLGFMAESEKISRIGTVISNVRGGQITGLLLMNTLIPFAFMTLSYFSYKKRYKIDEEEYERICKELEIRRLEADK